LLVLQRVSGASRRGQSLGVEGGMRHLEMERRGTGARVRRNGVGVDKGDGKAGNGREGEAEPGGRRQGLRGAGEDHVRFSERDDSSYRHPHATEDNQQTSPPNFLKIAISHDDTVGSDANDKPMPHTSPTPQTSPNSTHLQVVPHHLLQHEVQLPVRDEPVPIHVVDLECDWEGQGCQRGASAMRFRVQVPSLGRIDSDDDCDPQSECGIWNVECGMWNVECGMWNVSSG
jgi:hypothetical protein